MNGKERAIMKKNVSHSLAAALRQVPLLVIIAALVGITVNALRPGGLTLGGATAPVVAGVRNAAAGGPVVQVPDYRFEFDPVPEGAEVEHAFIVRNRGAQVLRIERVKPG